MPQTFAQWWAKNLPDVKHFTAAEFLTLGGEHHIEGKPGYGLNTLPPRALWPNVIPLVNVLDALRERVGVPVRLSNVYRSPAYNAAIKGAKDSQHMQFKAADISVGAERPADVAATLRKMRSDGMFEGGVGLYNGFVHVDVRGSDADWDKRTGAQRAIVGRVLGAAAREPADAAVEAAVQRGPIPPYDPGMNPNEPEEATSPPRPETGNSPAAAEMAVIVTGAGITGAAGIWWLAAIIVIAGLIVATRKWWWPKLRRK